MPIIPGAEEPVRFLGCASLFDMVLYPLQAQAVVPCANWQLGYSVPGTWTAAQPCRPPSHSFPGGKVTGISGGPSYIYLSQGALGSDDPEF